MANEEKYGKVYLTLLLNDPLWKWTYLVIDTRLEGNLRGMRPKRYDTVDEQTLNLRLCIPGKVLDER